MKKRLKRLLLVLPIMLLLIAGGFLYINANLKPVLVGLSKARVESVAAKAMNDAILEILSESGATDDLLIVHANEDGVYLLQANSGKLNAVAAQCADSAQERIMALGEQGITIPLGTVLGIPLFSGKGPKLTLRFTPAGAVQSSFESAFADAGINQTIHKITLRLTATVRIILPGESHTVTISSVATIAESIIVGDVPSTYADVDDGEEILNLVP